VRGAQRRRHDPPEQHPRAAARAGGEVRQPRDLVRHRAGVHVLRRQQAAGLAGARVPGAAGRLLLWRRQRRGVRPRGRRGPRLGVPARRAGDRRHQRRGHAGAVGVPDRHARPGRHGRSAVARALAALPDRRGVRRQRDAAPQADQGRLERRRRAHQRQHQGDARAGRHQGDRGGVREAARPPRGAHQGLRRVQRRAPHRQARDLLDPSVPLRHQRPRRLDPDPDGDRERGQGLLRGSPAGREHGPARRRRSLAVAAPARGAQQLAVPAPARGAQQLAVPARPQGEQQLAVAAPAQGAQQLAVAAPARGEQQLAVSAPARGAPQIAYRRCALTFTPGAAARHSARGRRCRR